MTRLVECRYTALILGKDHALPLGPEHDFVLRRLEVVHVHPVLVVPGGQESGLVDDVCEIGPRQARRTFRQDLEIDIVPQGNVFDVNLQNPLATLHIGIVHHDLAIEASRAQ